jgi:hypothetical protein
MLIALAQAMRFKVTHKNNRTDIQPQRKFWYLGVADSIKQCFMQVSRCCTALVRPQPYAIQPCEVMHDSCHRPP